MVKEIPVQLNLAEKLESDVEFRNLFFRTQVQNDIADQIIRLRNKRGRRQIDVAQATGMKQSAISRIEQAEYASWNFQTLLRITEALEARLKINVELIEDVINNYREIEKTHKKTATTSESYKYWNSYIYSRNTTTNTYWRVGNLHPGPRIVRKKPKSSQSQHKAIPISSVNTSSSPHAYSF